MATTRVSTFARLFGESVAIFAGVVFALAADDWRQTRSEQREASAGLALLVEDLRADSAHFAVRETVMARHASAAAWLIEEWDRAHEPPDSVETALFQFNTGGLARFNRTAFEGLRDSNRLRLIESDSIRAGISQYYQRTQVNISQYWDFAYAVGFELQDDLAPHVRNPTGQDRGALWPYGEDRVELRHAWTEVAADPILENRLHQYGVLSGFLAGQFADGQASAGALIRLLASNQLSR